MKLPDLKNKLDSDFNIENMPADFPFSNSLPKKYDQSGIDYRKYYADEFLVNYHGLALNNSDNVSKVYLAVFLSEEIVEKILEKKEHNVLVFVHHPMNIETSGRGTVPLPEKYLLELREQNISVYVLHSPLDVNEKISTSASLAKALNISVTERYDKEDSGFHGVAGYLPKKVIYEEFIATIKKELNIDNPYHLKRKDYVYRVGVIAGGGSDIAYINETSDLGCDTYVTGDYINRLENENGELDRQKFESQKSDININLIASSHYASEKCVLANEMKKYFEEIGLACELIEHKNPWE